ncbi:MAG: cytoplasmic protein [Candidatus Thorarchaeota archaeon]
MRFMFLATEDNRMQFMHILLNALHFHESGHETAVVLECAAPKLLIALDDGSFKLPLFDEALEHGIINHACRACSTTFSAIEAAERLGVSLDGPLHGHTNLLSFVEQGFSIIRF